MYYIIGQETALFLIPKKNIVNMGLEWTKIVKRMIEDHYLFLKNHYLRKMSESGFYADKRRFEE